MGDFQNNKKKSQRFLRLQWREYGLQRGGRMAGFHYVAIKSLSQVCKLLYFKIIHQCTCICGCEISEWKACQTITNGFKFYKKRNQKSLVFGCSHCTN